MTKERSLIMTSKSSEQFSEVDLPVVDAILQHVERIYDRLKKTDVSQGSSQSLGGTCHNASDQESNMESGIYSNSTSQLEALNCSLRSELRTLRESNFELERKLDAKQSELAEQISNAESLLTQVRQDAALWREKYAALCQDRQEDKTDLETIKNYIATLPTRDELAAGKMEVAKYKSEFESLRGQLDQVRLKLSASQQENQLLRRQNEDLEVSQVQLRASHEDLLLKWEERDKMKDFGRSDLEKEFMKLDSELKNVKKVAAHREKRFKVYREECEEKIKDLKDQLDHLSDRNAEDKQHLKRKESEVEILCQRIKELQTENRKSLDVSSGYQRHLNQYLSQTDVREEELEVSNLVAQKSEYCSHALSSMVTLVNDWMEGIEPDFEKLFTSSEFQFLKDEPSDCLKALLRSCQNIENVQKSVSYLRTLLNEQYAKHLGSQATNMTCIQQ